MQISDFFYSIQGEGANVGLAMQFLRFTGCDLACSFCDIDFDLSKVIFSPELAEALDADQ